MSPKWWTILPLVIITFTDLNIANAVGLNSSLQNSTVRRGGHVKLILYSIPNVSPSQLTCECILRDGTTYQIATSNSGMNGLRLNNERIAELQPLQFELRPNSTIIISNITFQYERTSFRWLLMFFSPQNTFKYYTSKLFNIESVQEPPSVYGTKLNAISEADEGKTLILMCKFIGRPLSKGQWDKSFERLGQSVSGIGEKAGDLDTIEVALLIKEVNYTHDQMKGHCSTSNKFGKAIQSTKLNVKYSPKESKLITVNSNPREGENITLNCSAKANPKPSRYQIFRSGSPIAETTTGQFMFLSKDCSAESGQYSCMVYNAYGKGQLVTTMVNISGPIRITAANVTINEYENTTLSCTATGCPSPSIIWYRQGSPIPLHYGNNLNLLSVTSDQAGIYQCVASNKDGNKTVNVMLSVRYSPRSSELKLVTSGPRENSNITLRCSTKAYPPVDTYRIYKGSILLQNSTSADYTFLARNCKNESGLYSCEVSNELGMDKANLTLDIYGPPVAKLVNLLAEVFVNESNNVTLTCSARGCPQPNITWFQNEHNILPARTKRLALTFVKPNSAGKYVCMASNRVENHTSSTILRVRYSPRNLSLVSNMKDGLPQEGAPLRLTCKASAYPKANYELYRDDKLLNTSQSGSFTFKQTQCKVHSGNYSCRALNSQGSSSRKYLMIKIDGRPKLKSSLKDRIVNETSNLELFCRASGCPHPKITWKLSNKVVGHGEKLRITNIQANETGQYTCVASNRAGSTNSTFMLTVQYAPKETHFKGPATARTGSKVEFSCNAKSEPVARYRFYKMSSVTKMTTVSSPDSEATGVLIVNNIGYDSSYRTTYGCISSNLIGDGPSKETSIEIEVPPINQTILPRDDEVARKIGTSLNLTCSVEIANPQVKVTWLKQGKKVLSGSSVLPFPSLGKEDSGLYTCNATNKHGTLSKSLSLNVTYPPVVSPTILTEFNKCIDSTITIECFGTGNPMPTATIRFAGNILASQWKKTSRELTVTNENYGMYICEVKNMHGTATESISVKKQLYPGVPSSIEIKPKENNLEISWTAPKCLGQAGVASYIIYYRGKKDVDEKKEPVTCESNPCKFTLRSLSEETTYDVAIVAVDKNGKEGSKQIVQGIKTKAVIATEKSSKLSGTTAAFIGIGAVIVFLLAIALFVMIRRRSRGDDVEDNASAPKRSEQPPPTESSLKFDNAAYDNAVDVKDQSNGKVNQNENDTDMAAASDNSACKVDEDEEAGNVPMKEEEEVVPQEEEKQDKEEKGEEKEEETSEESEKYVEKGDTGQSDGKSVVIKKDNIYESVKADDV